MTGLPIRVRLTLWYSAILLVTLTAFGAGMSMALKRRLTAGVDAVLQQRLDGLRAMLEAEGHLERAEFRIELSEFAREMAEGSLITLEDDTGTVLLSGAVAVDRSATGLRTEQSGDRVYRVLSSDLQVSGRRYRAVLASDLEPTSHILSDFRRGLLWLIPLVLIVAGAGGYWLSSRALAPVDEITRVAKSISVENLSRRLKVSETHDEIQRMSEAWNGVLERLESAVNRIQQFTADASHELRTPVALIRATAELALRRERSSSEYRRSLREVQEEAERITELTESLLQLARTDAGGVGMPLEPVDLTELIGSVTDQYADPAAQKGVTLGSRVEAARPRTLANGPAMRRLLVIFIENALRHTPPGGSIQITAADSAEGIVLAVDDTGDGIPAEAAGHIFERFYRADKTRSAGSGLGLGLSIAEKIAQAHNTSITVETRQEQGTRFALLLRPC